MTPAPRSGRHARPRLLSMGARGALHRAGRGGAGISPRIQACQPRAHAPYGFTLSARDCRPGETARERCPVAHTNRGGSGKRSGTGPKREIHKPNVRGIPTAMKVVRTRCTHLVARGLSGTNERNVNSHATNSALCWHCDAARWLTCAAVVVVWSAGPGAIGCWCARAGCPSP